jgi:CheY-like chemotaxis protein
MSKILIAEDDPVTGRVYSDLLTRAGFEVELFVNGLAFMARVPDPRPDAVLLDMMLPGLSGIEIIKRVRATWYGKELPIVALTNAYIPKMIEEIEKAGPNIIYDKGILTPTQLVDTFRGLLGTFVDPAKAPQISDPAANQDCDVSEGGWATVRTFRKPNAK